MLALGDVGFVELPVLFRAVDAAEEALFLLVLGDVEEELGDADAVGVAVGLEVADVFVAFVEELFHVLGGFLGQALVVDDDVGVDLADEDLLVVGAIEDADATAGGQALVGPPHEVVVELVLGGLFEAVDVNAVGVHAAEDVLDGAVFAAGVHGLKDEEHGVAVLRIHHLLKFIDLAPKLVDQLAVVGLVLVEAGDSCGPLHQGDVFLFVGWDAELGDVDFEFHSLGVSGLYR